MKIIRVGIIGAGHVFPYYRSAISKHAFFEISGVYDKRKLAPKNPKSLTICSSLASLLLTEPDIIAILTDSRSRYELAKEILAQGIPVILEKPPTETLEQYDELVKLALQNETFIFGALHSRYTTTHAFVRNQMHITSSGSFHKDLGRLTKIELSRFDPYITDGKLAENLPEKTSGLDSWPNIFAELALFVDQYQIYYVSNLDASHSPQCLEARSEVTGKTSGKGIFNAKTDWTQGINQKKTRLTFINGTIVMDHTLQKICITSGGKHTTIDLSNMGDRMMLEYFYMFQEIYDVFHGLKNSNSSTTRDILLSTLSCFEMMVAVR
jgi:hypothetical protein